MDALPVEENRTDVRLNSAGKLSGPGCGCDARLGHDAHITILLGTAKVLSDMAQIPGTIKFIFQACGGRTPPGERWRQTDD